MGLCMSARGDTSDLEAVEIPSDFIFLPVNRIRMKIHGRVWDRPAATSGSCRPLCASFPVIILSPPQPLESRGHRAGLRPDLTVDQSPFGINSCAEGRNIRAISIVYWVESHKSVDCDHEKYPTRHVIIALCFVRWVHRDPCDASS
jgi:hypothetical protein